MFTLTEASIVEIIKNARLRIAILISICFDESVEQRFLAYDLPHFAPAHILPC